MSLQREAGMGHYDFMKQGAESLPPVVAAKSSVIVYFPIIGGSPASLGVHVAAPSPPHHASRVFSLPPPLPSSLYTLAVPQRTRVPFTIAPSFQTVVTEPPPIIPNDNILALLRVRERGSVEERTAVTVQVPLTLASVADGDHRSARGSSRHYMAICFTDAAGV